jgi:metal-responsive CopG/Arc/MetJ family transcriptional regulator
MTNNEIQFSVRIPKSLIEKLDQLADNEHRTRNKQIEKILWDYFYKQIDNKGTSTSND